MMNQTSSQISRPIGSGTRSEVFILEKRYIEYCNCRVKALVQLGQLYRSEDSSLWYATSPHTFDELGSLYKTGELTYVSDDLAITLEIGTAHWKVEGVFRNSLTDLPKGLRATAFQVRPD